MNNHTCSHGTESGSADAGTDGYLAYTEGKQLTCTNNIKVPSLLQPSICMILKDVIPGRGEEKAAC